MKLALTKLLKPIRTKKDYEKALSGLEEVFDAKRGTPEGDIAEILAILIERYEEEHYPIKSPHPMEAILFRMDQMGLTRKDLAELLGGRSRVSELVNRKRKLSLTMIRKVFTHWGVPAESLIEAES